MAFQMSHISAFGILFSYISFLNQSVEPIRPNIAPHHTRKLVLAKSHQFLNRLAKVLEERFRNAAVTLRCFLRFHK